MRQLLLRELILQKKVHWQKTMSPGLKLRVLVADDDNNSRDSLSHLLAKEGFRTLCANGGQQALQFLQAWQPNVAKPEASRPLVSKPKPIAEAGKAASQQSHSQDAPIHFVVIDYNMPDLTGLEVLKRVRELHGVAVPTILVTGEGSIELEKAFISLGGFAMLPKPIQPVQFRSLVWQLVQTNFPGMMDC